MGFESPWNLLWLLGVASVATFTLLRPTRSVMVVPSLSLWTQVVGTESKSVSRSRRKMSLRWLLLLLGAVFGVLAISKPVLYPPGTDVPAKGALTVAPVTLDAFAAQLTSGKQVEVFVSLRNNTNKQLKIITKLTSVSKAPGIDHPLSIAPNATASFIERIPATSAIELTFGLAEGRFDKKISKSRLVRHTRRRAKVAVIGALSELLHRYISADDILDFTPNSSDADVLVTNGTAIPGNWTKPALSINPPHPPGGWRSGETLQNVLLSSAHGAAGPILKNVDLSTIAVRHLTPWIPGDNPSQIVVARFGNDGIILRNDPTATSTPLPRRVYIAFDCSAENTNLPFTQQYVVLMGNIFRWIIPKTAGKTFYEQLQSNPREDNICDSGNILMERRRVEKDFQLWGYLTAVAILFWIAGWSIRGGDKNIGDKLQ